MNDGQHRAESKRIDDSKASMSEEKMTANSVSESTAEESSDLEFSKSEDQKTDDDLKNMNNTSDGIESQSIEDSLPETVSVLEAPNGSKVYLVGSAHFSQNSMDDVDKTVELVRPEYIMLELCRSRTGVLLQDEETLLAECSSMDMSKMIQILKKDGTVRGLLYILMLSVSAHITRQLGLAPGVEFRAAVKAMKKYVPNARIQLVDRSINITFERAIKKLSLWQKVKLFYNIIFSFENISPEDVEACKKSDILETLIDEIGAKLPEFCDVLVKERDQYLAFAMLEACSYDNLEGLQAPHKSVAVVGIGHVKGIKANWGKVSRQDIAKVLEIPKVPVIEVVTLKCLKYGMLALVGYGCYKLVLPSALKTKMADFAVTSIAAVATSMNIKQTSF